MSAPVVLVHGLGSSFEHNWGVTGWIDILESESFEVVGHELPGHGSAPQAPGGETEAVQRLVSLVTDRAPVLGIGFSAGARLILRAAIASPDSFEKVVLLGIGDGMWQQREEGSGEMPDLVLQLLETAGNDRDSVQNYVDGFTAMPALSELSKLTMPTLVVIGERDMVGPVDDMVAALPNAKAVVLKGVDHFSTTSNFNCQDAVLRFLSE
ncbi:MAG: alpha/beta hydrolase [Actinomycetota bacterium]|nr:alpha/beta hydrolase [Actinomycetota bacterium]